jgi:hypothetical protein
LTSALVSKYAYATATSATLLALLQHGAAQPRTDTQRTERGQDPWVATGDQEPTRLEALDDRCGLDDGNHPGDRPTAVEQDDLLSRTHGAYQASEVLIGLSQPEPLHGRMILRSILREQR